MEALKMKEEELVNLDKKIPVEMVLSLQGTVDQLSENMNLLLEQIKLMNSRSFSNKAETASSLNVQLSLDLHFNEAEALCDEETDEPAIETVIRKKKQKGHKEEFLKKITNHRDVELYLTDDELNNKYGKGKWKRLPDEIISKLEHHPASFEVINYHIGVYAADDNQTIIRALKPAELIPGSIVTPSLLSSIIFAKYVNGVPLYRQEKAFENSDIFLSRTNMANWIIAGYDRYFYDRLKSILVKEDLIHADETPFLINKDGRVAGSKSYMWVYRSSVSSDHQIVLYDSCHTRGSANPKRFLKEYKGVVVCDGFDAYHKMGNDEPERFRIACCFAHARRKFSDIIKINGSSSLADTAIKKIAVIYHEDNRLKDLDPPEKKKKRKETIEPLVNDFFRFIASNIGKVPDKSATGKAFSYCLNQEKYLRAFIDDPLIPLDNNPAERAIRPFTIGRKNWVMIDTVKGADASACIYSIIETGRANNLKLYDYINYLLEELPKCISGFDVSIPDRLLPWSDEFPDSLRKTKDA
ncbi:MAG: IS66 family transposase [Erysipelotrichaceae bacterium]|nr:IS66 family transposase [Erysipelotrichaceae bacterium]